VRVLTRSLVALASLVVLACSGEDAAPGVSARAAGTPPAVGRGSGDPREEAIYALGYSLAPVVSRYALDETEVELLAEGLRDGVLGRAPRVAPEAQRLAIRRLGEARAAAAAAAGRVAGAAFLAREAAVAGANVSDSGLIKRVVRPGDGDVPDVLDTVHMHYEGRRPDGTVFDSSLERGEPARVRLTRVIPCWTEALSGMRVGEKAHITCPPDLAYGDAGAAPRIPPGSALAFDVELLEIVRLP
jgi:FKBP-type peptidyl-prolyl cis-trans isomerase